MRKFHPLITRILVMTASGFLLISIAGSYTPAVSPAPEQAIRISHDNAADISQSGSAACPDYESIKSICR